LAAGERERSIRSICPLLAQLVAMCPGGRSDALLRISRSSAPALALSTSALAAGGPFVTPLTGANGTIASQLGVQGKYSPSVNRKVVYTGLPEGEHSVTVFLVKNTHANYKNAGAKKTIMRIRTAITAVAGKIEHTVADSTKSGTVRSTIIRPRPVKHGQALTYAFASAGPCTTSAPSTPT
jgi:hypothetical protein